MNNNTPSYLQTVGGGLVIISPPYIQCPDCKEKDTFGVLSIAGNQYTRRCIECRFTDSYKLPSLNKKVIYLDQFIISNMALAINKKLNKQEKVDKFYLKLFEELDQMVKFQLIICPDSEFHRQESLPSNYEVLKKMYKYLSRGINFRNSIEIEMLQISEGFKNWLEKKPTSVMQTSPLPLNRNYWLDNSPILIKINISEEEIKEYQQMKQKISNSNKLIFQKWQSDKRKFNDFYRENLTSYSQRIRNQYYSIVKSYLASTGRLTLNTDEIIPHLPMRERGFTCSLLNYLPDEKNNEEKFRIVSSYLSSSEITELPFIQIDATLEAAIAHQAAHRGRLNPPNKGMAIDIKMVSTLLPYCDAIFVDSDMFSLLNFGEVKRRITLYGTKVFSPTNKKDFLTYLNRIQSSASQEHLNTVKMVYGEERLRPFWQLYEV